MLFRKKLTFSFSRFFVEAVKLYSCCLFFGVLAACSPAPEDDASKDQYIIGEKLSGQTGVMTDTTSGTGITTVTMFDETLRKVHQFDVGRMVKTKTIKVQNPQLPHYVVSSPDGADIIDITDVGVSIYARTGAVFHDALKLPSSPKSAAYDHKTGTIVVYDQNMNVGLIKFLENGNPITKTMGPLIGEDTIVSGELADSGELVVALTNKTLAIVNVEKTISTGIWNYQTVPVNIGRITWISRIQKSPNTLFVHALDIPNPDGSTTAEGFATINYKTGAILNQSNISGRLVLLSKESSGHAIASSSEGHKYLYYSNPSNITMRTLHALKRSIVGSSLDPDSGKWFLYTSTWTGYYKYYSYDVNWVRSDRRVSQFRIGDMGTEKEYQIPNEAQVLPTNEFFFSLFPSNLGYALKTDINSGRTSVLKGFNIKEFDR